MLLNFSNIFVIALGIPDLLIQLVPLLNILFIVNLIAINLQRTSHTLGPYILPLHILQPHMALNLGHSPFTAQPLFGIEFHQLGYEIEGGSAPGDWQEGIVDVQRLGEHRGFYFLFGFAFERTLGIIRERGMGRVLSPSLVRRLAHPERSSPRKGCGFSVGALQALELLFREIFIVF